MTLHLPPLNYDCLQCGKSCYVFGVEIAPDEHERLRHSPLTQELERQGYEPLRVLPSGRMYLGKEDRGRCTYLAPDQLCGLHKQEGYEAKPRVCREFPFVARPTPDGIFLGLSFACAAVARNSGRSLEERRAELEERYLGEPMEHSLPLWEERPLAWRDYLRVEALLLQGLASPMPPELSLLLGAVSLVEAVRADDLTRLGQPVQPNPALGRQADALLAGVITLMETHGQGPERVEHVLRCFDTNSPYESRALEKEVDLPTLPRELPEGYDALARRFLEHLIFRKWLLGTPDLLSRVCTLPVVAHALSFFTLASSQGQGRPAGQEDMEKALEIVEGKLTLHARGMESYFSRIGRVFLEQA